jgi:Flp pilus assembly protein CpaB
VLEAKRRIGLFLTLGVILASAAAWLTYGRVSAVEGQLGKRMTVYVAARPVAAQVPLTTADLSTIYIPATFLQPDMVTDPKDLTGKVALIPLNQGQMLTRPMLTTRFVVPDGSRVLRLYRSQTIYFDDNLLAGDRVDLMVTYLDPADKQQKLTTHVHLNALPVVESDSKGAWVGILVRDRDADGVIQMENSAKQIQLLRLSPAEGGSTR